MADALEEDRRAPCEELIEPREQKPHSKMHKNESHLLVAGSFILHENARPYIADVVTKKLRDYVWEVLPHAPYSPDFDLFTKLKRTYAWTTFFFSGRVFYRRDGTRAIRT